MRWLPLAGSAFAAGRAWSQSEISVPAAERASLWYAVLIVLFAAVVAIGVWLNRRDGPEEHEATDDADGSPPRRRPEP